MAHPYLGVLLKAVHIVNADKVGHGKDEERKTDVGADHEGDESGDEKQAHGDAQDEFEELGDHADDRVDIVANARGVFVGCGAVVLEHQADVGEVGELRIEGSPDTVDVLADGPLLNEAEGKAVEMAEGLHPDVHADPKGGEVFDQVAEGYHNVVQGDLR